MSLPPTEDTNKHEWSLILHNRLKIACIFNIKQIKHSIQNAWETIFWKRLLYFRFGTNGEQKSPETVVIFVFDQYQTQKRKTIFN